MEYFDIYIKNTMFVLVAALTVLPCLFVAFSRNLLHASFALFFTFLGASGLYFFLEADLLAVVQLVIYIGGVMVLLLFAILLTKNIEHIKRSNAVALGRAITAAVVAVVMFALMAFAIVSSDWMFKGDTSEPFPFNTAEAIGSLLLSKYLLPFEAASMLLLVVLIGSLLIAKKAVK